MDAVDTAFHKSVLDGVQNACIQSNVHLIIYATAILFDNIERQNLYSVVRKYIFKNDIDGLLVLTGDISEHYGLRNTIELIKSIRDIPVLSISTTVPDTTSILIDNEMGIKQLFSHLTNKHDCKKIAFIKGPECHEEAELRFNAYLNELDKYGLPFNENLVVESNGFDETHGYNAAKKLFSRVKNSIDNIDAIMSADDSTAIGVAQYLKEQNWKIPDDIIITGFDNTEEAAFHAPSLTTVHQPFFELGSKAAERLISGNLCNGDVIKVPTELKTRESCGCTWNKSIDSFISMLQSDTSHFYVMNNDFTAFASKALKESLSFSAISMRLKNHLKHDYDNYKPISYWTLIVKNTVELIEESDCSYNLKFELSNELNTILFEFIELEKRRNVILSEKESFNLHFLSHKLLSSQSKTALFSTLSCQLPKLKVSSFYLCLYEEVFSYAEIENNTLLPETVLCALYSKNKNVEKYENYTNTIKHLLPDELIQDEASILYLPICFKDTFFGYAIIDFNSDADPLLYEILRISIASALHSCNTIKKMKMLVDQKTNFLVNLTHEIKTPLSIISSYIEKYLASPDDINDIQIANQYIHKIKRDLTNILDFEKIEQKQHIYDHHTSICLTRFIKDKLIAFKELLNSNQIRIETLFKEDLYINMDPSALDRILNNLIENAIKYNHPSGLIFISLNSTSEKIYLEISNTGEVIPSELNQRIFSPYYQINNSSQGAKGIGIGLSIVKNIVAELNGSITAGRKNNMTYFVITLPRSHTLTNKTYQQSTPVVIEEENIQLEYFDFDSQKPSILIVEDNIQLLAFLKNQLNEYFNVYYALNGKEAMNELPQIPIPDLIISDMMMEHMDGMEFLQRLKRSKKWNLIPLLFLSAKSGNQIQLDAYKHGAIDYISKPFSFQMLLQKINNLISTQQNHKTREREKLKADFMAFFENDSSTSRSLQKRASINKNYKELFSDRELEAIGLLEKGYQYKEIASEMGISMNTLKTYIKRMYHKLEVNNRVELLRKIYSVST